MLEAAILRGCVDHRAKGVDQFTARATVQRQCEHRASIVRRALARPGHALLHIFRQFVLPPDVLQTNIVFIQCWDFRLQIAAQQAHQEIDFALGTLLPVFFREGVERYSVNAGARRRLHRRTDGRNPGAMSGHARHMAPVRPAPVAVHDDGDVFWEPPWIKLPVDFRFFPIQPRGYFVLQSDPLRIEANTGGKWVAMTRGYVLGSVASKGTISHFLRRQGNYYRYFSCYNVVSWTNAECSRSRRKAEREAGSRRSGRRRFQTRTRRSERGRT